MGYRIQDGTAGALTKFLRSKSFEALGKELLEKTGIRKVDTYFVVEPSSADLDDNEAWNLWEGPNCGAIDGCIESQARRHFFQKYRGPFVERHFKRVTVQLQALCRWGRHAFVPPRATTPGGFPKRYPTVRHPGPQGGGTVSGRRLCGADSIDGEGRGDVLVSRYSLRWC